LAKYATVDEYVAALAEPLRQVAQHARAAIDLGLPDASCAIRWAHPTWSLGRTPVCYLRAASHHLTFGFWHGASINDPSGRLETGGQVMAHTKLRTVDDVAPDLFAAWLRQARDLSRRPGDSSIGGPH
jgi:hypothetical protein